MKLQRYGCNFLWLGCPDKKACEVRRLFLFVIPKPPLLVAVIVWSIASVFTY
ncbi:hypothetical protein VC95412_000928 [Vibrio cholerae O1 str. 95412]|nr:hypothetical protein VC95412_000928 [Vibrio cholerae O1 str. 95412]